MPNFETVVGFEIHVELDTQSKVFCGCSMAFGQPPNTQTCPICLGLPGSLPVINRKAVELSMRAALALNCKIEHNVLFERKNYFYPDLPKSYQLTQLKYNLGYDGWLDLQLKDGIKRIRINNAHLEEDAGKLLHSEVPGETDSLVDLNRSSATLLEIVTEPDIRTLEEAEVFMQTLKSILEYTKASDCNMHEGRLRFEANISVRPRGSETFGKKVEIKNINSMRTVLKCIETEGIRQREALRAGESIRQETRLWDEVASLTRAMRSKETANDYRYFPDPDLITLHIDDAWIDKVRAELPELPKARCKRFIEELGLSDYDAGVLTAEKTLADYFEMAVNAHSTPKTAAKAVANWIMTETLRFLNEDAERTIADYPIPAKHLGELVTLIDKGEISSSIAKKVYAAMMNGEGDPASIVKAKGLVQITDTSTIEPIVDEVLSRNAEAIANFKAGKERALGAIVGQVMKASQGKANPQLVNELILKKIKD